MSDTGRQSMTDNIKGAMKPDSQKSMTEQAGEKADSMVGDIMPNSMKSTSQKTGDNLTGKDGESMLNKAKNAVGMGSSNNNTGSGNN